MPIRKIKPKIIIKSILRVNRSALVNGSRRFGNTKNCLCSMTIKNGAIFIADVHYNCNRKELIRLLDDFIQNPPPQLFLAGDIFDLLIGSFAYLAQINNDVIAKSKSFSF